MDWLIHRIFPFKGWFEELRNRRDCSILISVMFSFFFFMLHFGLSQNWQWWKDCIPKNLRGNILESVTLLGHLDNYISVVARSGKMFVVVLTASCFRAKAVSLWNSEGNIRPKVSSLSVDKMPGGVTCLPEFNQSNFLLPWTHTNKGCPFKRQKKPKEKFQGQPEGSLFY